MSSSIYDILDRQEKEVLERSTEEFKNLVEVHGADWKNIRVNDDKLLPLVSDDLKSSNPSDLLVVTSNLYSQFHDLLNGAGLGNKMGVPSDIFEAGTIPMRDCLIEIELPNMDNLVYRVTVLFDEDGFDCGYLTFQENEMIITWPIESPAFFNETDKMVLSLFNVFAPGSETGFKILSNAKNVAPGFLMHTYMTMDLMFKLWYAFQICLLNPEVKDVIMRKTGKEKLDGRCYTSKKDKRKARYVKRHRVESDIFKTATDGSIERHTLCWYVIGHWRNYSNGKKTFVKPYWKGPLRHMEKNFDQGRERVV